jgi:hypothetical protein
MADISGAVKSTGHFKKEDNTLTSNPTTLSHVYNEATVSIQSRDIQ